MKIDFYYPPNQISLLPSKSHSVPVPFCEMDAVKYLGNGATVLWRFTFVVQSKNSRKR